MSKKQFYEKLGRGILNLRRKRCITREMLAEYAGISPRYLYEIEKGNKGCSVYVLYRIASVLRVDTEQFLEKCFDTTI